METKRIGRQTVQFSHPPAVLSFGSVAGKMESSGPLGDCFDYAVRDDSFGQKSWEKAETAMQRKALSIALEQGGLEEGQLDFLLAGDLLNQCIATSYSVRAVEAPFFGLYGACSTMAEGLSLGAMLVDGGFGACAAAMTSSHFCSAERQYRNPLEYGGQRPPTAQWTATGSGAVILGREGKGPYLTHATAGRVVDWGITDANNMGAAMAPVNGRLAPYPTIWGQFADFLYKNHIIARRYFVAIYRMKFIEGGYARIEKKSKNAPKWPSACLSRASGPWKEHLYGRTETGNHGRKRHPLPPYGGLLHPHAGGAAPQGQTHRGVWQDARGVPQAGASYPL